LYNLSVYGNLILNKNSEDFILTEGEYIPKKENYDTKLLIGDTIDYKLFISILVDNKFNYSDKYLTLNITRTLLKIFIVITIISVSFCILGWIWSNLAGIEFNIEGCFQFIIENCYFINDDNNGKDWFKLGIIIVIFLILCGIFAIDITMPQKKYEKYIIDKSEEKTLTTAKYKWLNLEKYLNTDSNVFKDNNNIDILINHLKGYNIHTINNISDIDKINGASDKEVEEYNKFINNIKNICDNIKKKYDNKKIYENKDLDFVKLIIIFLNNIKIYNDDKKKGFNETDKDFLHPKVFLNYIINIITSVIPGISDIEDIKKNKIEDYDLYNILIGGIPLSIRNTDFITSASCSATNYEKKLNGIDEEKGSCIYDNYLLDLKEFLYTDSIWKNKLKGALILIFVFALISIIIIIILFIYIFVNYNKEYKNYAKITTVKLIRDSNYKNAWYLGMGKIINSLIKK
jgi:heme/copper-type cytochrome/quinol oxidase subunit 4